MSAITPSPTHELISVVIPIYNAEKTLDACLRSVEEQTHAELEIICVNDGSSDSSARIAREHAARDSRIVIIEKTNEGYGASCNRGIAIARGTWVAIVEPDDLLEPTCYADLLACAEEHGGAAEVDVVRAPYWRVIGEGDRQERVSCPYKGRVRPSRQPFAIGDGIELLRHHPAIWSGVYRRGYLAEKGIRFPEVPGAGWADNPFLVETLCQTDRIVYTDRCVYVYFERDLNEAEALARRSPLVPLERWNEMMDVVERAGITDRRVLSALALRGVNYALITLEGAGPKAPGVRELVERSLRRLDPGTVFQEAAISTAGRELYARVRRVREPRGGKARHLAYLAREGLYRMRANGMGFSIKTALSRRGNRLG